MAKLKDLSEYLGLSVTQVSRALNGYSDVSEATRKRVKEAATALKYSPNLSARKLASGRSGLVGLVRPYHQEITTDAMFFEVVTGLSLQFSQLGMHFLLHVTPEREKILDVYGELIAGGSLDGFIVTEPHLEDPRIEYLQEREIPFVVHGRNDYETNYAFVDIDNFQVGYQLTKMALDAGHERVAIALGIEGRGYNRHRLDGYSAALTEAGIAIDPSLVFNARMTEEYGREVVDDLWQREVQPTALLCGHMRIAVGVYDAAAKAGIRIGEDLAVAAHDDQLLGVTYPKFKPKLAVTIAPVDDHWATMARFLDRLIAGDDATDLQEIQPINAKPSRSLALGETNGP